MSDSTSNSVSFPINPDPNDKRPLPEIIADLFHFALPYVDHTDGKRYYVVLDWIAGVAQTDNPTRLWSDLKRMAKKTGFELYDSFVKLPRQGKNGKRYQIDCVVDVALYRMTQRLRAETGNRDRVLNYLAKSGVVLDEMRIDPDVALDAAITGYRREGRSEAFIRMRLLSKAGRNIFTVEFQRSMSKPPQRWMYAAITDVLRIGIWKRTTAQLRAQMKLKKDANVRDHQSTLALAYEVLAESICAEEFKQKSNLEFDESKQIVRTNSESVGQHAQATSRRLGIDIAISTDENTLPLDQSFPQIDA